MNTIQGDGDIYLSPKSWLWKHRLHFDFLKDERETYFTFFLRDEAYLAAVFETRYAKKLAGTFFFCLHFFFHFPIIFPPFVLFWEIDLDWLIRMFWYSSSSLELQRQNRTRGSRRVPLVCLLVCGGSSLFRSSLFSDCPLVCPWKSSGPSIRWSVAPTVDPSLTPP